MRLNVKKTALYIFTVVIVFLFYRVPVRGAGPIIIAIDPGHGGENLGAEYKEYTEKYMTMTVAEAMKKELEKYEGIKVYLTRENDKDMTLEERVEFAKSVNADFLFCLHFNMSVNHNLFGSEVWVSAFGSEYQRGYTFADIEIGMLKELGLYSRGIKTKLNDRGTDYYGIIRHATENNLASALIEHCHLDQENDTDFYTSEEKLKQFGILDATAVAKFYSLKSKILDVDYSSYQKIDIPVPVNPVKPDLTEPDVCLIELMKADENTGDITMKLIAEDYDSYMLYYSYSYDGGITFSDLQKWPEDGDTVYFTINIPSGIVPEIVVNAYNGFDKFTESNHISLPSMNYDNQAVEASSMIEAEIAKMEEELSDMEIAGTPADLPAGNPLKNKEDKKSETEIALLYFLQVSVICIAILFILFLLARILTSGHSKKKRRRRK